MKIKFKFLFVFASITLCLNLYSQSYEPAKDGEIPINMEIKKENANPAAQKLMAQAFFYDVTDEFAPFGNDVGNDTFYLYIEWKNKNETKKAIDFLKENLAEMGLSNFNLKTDTKNSKKLILIIDKMPNQYHDLYSIDNTVVSLAFSQLFLTGKIEPEIINLAKIAIEREILLADISEQNSKTRLEKLNKLSKVLNLSE